MPTRLALITPPRIALDSYVPCFRTFAARVLLDISTTRDPTRSVCLIRSNTARPIAKDTLNHPRCAALTFFDQRLYFGGTPFTIKSTGLPKEMIQANDTRRTDCGKARSKPRLATAAVADDHGSHDAQRPGSAARSQRERVRWNRWLGLFGECRTRLSTAIALQFALEL